MLTKKELQWLDNRGKFSCWYCPDIPQAMCTMGERPAHCAIMDTDYKDAAEFSERVAAKLAEFYHHTTLYLDDSDGQKLRCWETCPARFYCGDSYTHLTCGDAILKTAQLAVEEEMSNGMDI